MIMEAILPFVIGGLFAVGIYLLLQRSLGRLIIGLAILSNSVNLLIFTAGGLSRGSAPVIAENQTSLLPPFADPVPQALILTAIVIGFGTLAYSLVLVYRAYKTTGTDDADELKESDE
jgi:multicomponent Na+:H+ antiporter subunit C